MKKILTVLCSLAVLSTCGAMTAFAEENSDVSTDSKVMLGDLNGDGVINVNDAVRSLKDYAVVNLGETTAPAGYTEEEFKSLMARVESLVGDIDDNKKIDARDTVWILQYCAYKNLNPDSTFSIKEYYTKRVNGDLIFVDDGGKTESEFRSK